MSKIKLTIWLRLLHRGVLTQDIIARYARLHLAEAFLFEYEEDKAFDILLLDIEMENMNGIELAKRIRKDHNRAEIIFITSHFEFVWEGYEVDALPLSDETALC